MEPDIFELQQVPLEYDDESNIVAGQVANNILNLALASGSILRINLNARDVIDTTRLPGKRDKIGLIRALFVDPTGSHLIITTLRKHNFYLHLNSTTPYQLTAFANVNITSVGWNPARPTSSTREIIVGDEDGNVVEVVIDPKESTKPQYLTDTVGPIVGVHVESVGAAGRRVLVATPASLSLYAGNIRSDRGPVYKSIFAAPAATMSFPLSQATAWPTLTVSPANAHDRIYAWSTDRGVRVGPLPTARTAAAGPKKSDSGLDNILGPPRTMTADPPARAVALTRWHLLRFVNDRLVILNQLDGSVVLDQSIVLDDSTVTSRNFVGLVANPSADSAWLFTRTDIIEIVVVDESRHVSQIYLDRSDFAAAARFANTPAQQDAVATARGDHLMKSGDDAVARGDRSTAMSEFCAAATSFIRSSRPVEVISLGFLERRQMDSLRIYLTGRLLILKPEAKLQRTMMAMWLIDLCMAKLDELDEVTATGCDSRADADAVRNEFHTLVKDHAAELDPPAVYSTISSHGRDEELLAYAAAIGDDAFILDHWIRRERWTDAVDVLRRLADPDVVYPYASVLLANVPGPTVDLLIRLDVDAHRLVPALLDHARAVSGNGTHPTSDTDSRPRPENHAIRFLFAQVNDRRSDDPAIHNTLVSLLASDPNPDESALLGYLESPAARSESGPRYDADFALRLCVRHRRIRCCVHVYVSRRQYAEAVELALQHGHVEVATAVADQHDLDVGVRKRLWLAIAEHVIAGPVDGAKEADPAGGGGDGDKQAQPDRWGRSGIAAAAALLEKCPLLKTQDLIPFFPDFVRINDFRDHICQALTEYTDEIAALHTEMSGAALSVARIRQDVAALDQRFVLVTAGERCWLCGLPVLARPFYVFPSCLHSVHADCAITLATADLSLSSEKKVVVEDDDDPVVNTAARIAEVQAALATAPAAARDGLAAELDDLVADACCVCGDSAVRILDKPFTATPAEEAAWVF